jgi:O-antigen/teichoic acid export membrane protein
LRLTVLLQYPGLALANSIGPRVARTADGEPDYEAVQGGLRLMIVAGFAMVAPILAWAGPIVDLLLGDDYGASAGVLRAMTPFIFLQGLGIMLALSVNYLGEARRRVPVAVGAVLLNAAIDLLLLEPLGIVAAAIGTSAGYALYTAGHYVICRGLMNLRTRPLVATALRSVLVLFGTSGLGAAQWVAGLVLSAAAFVAVIVATREFGPGELRGLLTR